MTKYCQFFFIFFRDQNGAFYMTKYRQFFFILFRDQNETFYMTKYRQFFLILFRDQNETFYMTKYRQFDDRKPLSSFPHDLARRAMKKCSKLEKTEIVESLVTTQVGHPVRRW